MSTPPSTKTLDHLSPVPATICKMLRVLPGDAFPPKGRVWQLLPFELSKTESEIRLWYLYIICDLFMKTESKFLLIGVSSLRQSIPRQSPYFFSFTRENVLFYDSVSSLRLKGISSPSHPSWHFFFYNLPTFDSRLFNKWNILHNWIYRVENL